MDLVLFRVLFIAVIAASASYFRPFGWNVYFSAGVGLVLGLFVVLAEKRLERLSLRRLMGAAVGALAGSLLAFVVSVALASVNSNQSATLHFVQVALLLWTTYIGIMVGASKGDLLNLGALGGLFGGEVHAKKASKILDTSRNHRWPHCGHCRHRFSLDGLLVIPQFVLRELQLVADSGDSMKRNRGRRGLDVLQKIQKMDASRSTDRGR